LGLGFSVPLESIPSIAIEYAILKRDYLVQSDIYKSLIQKYERAKIDKLINTPSLKVVDWPYVPEEKYYPKKSIFLVVGIFLGFLIGIIFALLKNKIEEELKNNEVRKKWEKLIYEW